MSVVSKIKLPSNTTVDIHDVRVSEPTSSDSGKVLSVTDTSGTLGWVTPSTEIYWCTYGTTTFAELTTAWNEGKQILCFWSNRVYNLIYVGSSFTFGYVWGSTTYRLACSASSVWSNTSDSNQSQITASGLLKGNGSGSVTAAVAGTDYQQVLVSGTNIKTINNESLLGSGNITIQGGGGISILNIPVIPDLGEHSLGTKAQAATTLGITEAELDALMGGNYDRLVFENAIYADRTEAVHTYQSNVWVSYSYTGDNQLRFVFSTDGVEYFSLAERIVPELSTSIFNDGSSNTKAATPKAVKDYVDELPIPRVLGLTQFTPTESSSYISLGNAAAAATALSISEAQLEQLYEGGFNKVILRDRVEGKICIGSESLVNSNATGISYEIMSGDVTPHILEFIYQSAYKYRYYQLQGGGGSSDAVLYTAQTLTTSQQTQARTNIAAVGYNVTSTGTPVVLGLEQTTNKVTSLSASSTDTQYPSAKCVYDYIDDTVGDIATLLAAI